MILAAGRGERMRPLTDTCPKPLLPVGGKPLIVWHLQRLAQAGLRDIVINHAHLGQMLEAALGNGSDHGVNIAWSPERAGALETAGGIANALPLLGDDIFLVVNGDIYCDWNPAAAVTIAARMAQRGDLAHLVMVPNPPQHPQGDFVLDPASGRLSAPDPAQAGLGDPVARHTFSGIGLYAPQLFAPVVRGQPAKLAPLLRTAMAAGKVGGELHGGRWEDVGTPQRLQALDAELSAQQGAQSSGQGCGGSRAV